MTRQPYSRPQSDNPNWDKPKPASPEQVYYGVHACQMLWQQRPDDIIRVFLDQSLIPSFSPLLKWCASQKKVYRVLGPEEMQKVSKSIHHEGICIVAKEAPAIPFQTVLQSVSSKQRCCLIYLDGVQNPHNVGSITRVCAHFGVPYILGDKTTLPKLSPSSGRIAKGGAEFVGLIGLDNPKEALQQLVKAGFTLVATSSHEKQSVYSYRFHPKTVIILGGESAGVTEAVSSQAITTVAIPGSGKVESLNVAVAAGILVSEYYRTTV
jgi:TrmH RNA methyltransferase